MLDNSRTCRRRPFLYARLRSEFTTAGRNPTASVRVYKCRWWRIVPRCKHGVCFARRQARMGRRAACDIEDVRCTEHLHKRMASEVEARALGRQSCSRAPVIVKANHMHESMYLTILRHGRRRARRGSLLSNTRGMGWGLLVARTAVMCEAIRCTTPS